MRPDSPLRAEADSRFTDKDSNIQTSLFDQNFDLLESPQGQTLNDYRQRYGLSEDPFTDDPGFPLFTGGGRRQLLDQLLHLCQFSNQLLVITGEQGVGKTRIAHALADSLEEQDQLCFLALSPAQSLEQILIAIAESFNLDIPSPASIESLLHEIETYIDKDFSSGVEDEGDGLILIIIDNAEHLDSQSIAVLVSLLENKTQPYPLHLVLVGEPILVSRLNNIESESLQISDFHLPAFNLSETVDYLNFRMEMADYLGPEIFTDAIVDPWWRQARGQLSVIHEMAQDKLLQSVIPEPARPRSHLPVFHLIAISAVIAIATVLYLYLDDQDAQPELHAALPVNASSVQSQTSSIASIASSVALANTQTPTQPILQSLPGSENVVVSSVAATASSLAITEAHAAPVQLPESGTASSKAQQTAVSSADASTSIAESALTNNPPAASSINTAELTNPQPKNTSSNHTAHEKTILSWAPSQFTIQLLGVSSLKAAQEFVQEQSNASELLIFKTKRAGKNWFVVVTGHYSTNAAARAQINKLPAKQREAGPWPRQIKIIQEEIRQ